VEDRFWLVEGRRAEKNSLLQMRRNLTKKELLRKKSDISRIFREGRSVSAQGMKLLIRGNDLEWNRFMAIPAKKFGNAVARNRVKRHLKEIYRNDKGLLKQGYDIACIVYPGTINDFTMRKEQFYKLIKRAGLYHF
jgi:ribonuclease P protein component